MYCSSMGHTLSLGVVQVDYQILDSRFAQVSHSQLVRSTALRTCNLAARTEIQLTKLKILVTGAVPVVM